MYIDKLDYKINKYKNTYHSTIKMEHVDVKSSTYINFTIKNNEKNPEFEIVDCVRISKCKNVFANGYTPKRFEEVLLKKLKIHCHDICNRRL